MSRHYTYHTPLSSEQRARIIELLAMGIECCNAAERFGVSTMTIRKIAKENRNSHEFSTESETSGIRSFSSGNQQGFAQRKPLFRRG